MSPNDDPGPIPKLLEGFRKKPTSIPFSKSTSRRMARTNAPPNDSPWVYVRTHCHQMMTKAWSKATQQSLEGMQKLGVLGNPCRPETGLTGGPL